MTPAQRAEPTERAFRELVADAGLAPPDEVERHETYLLFLWHEQKLAIEIDLTDQPPEDLATLSD